MAAVLREWYFSAMIKGLPWFDMFRDDIEWEFHGLWGYVRSVEATITDLLSKEEKRVGSSLPTNDPEEAGNRWYEHDRLRGKLMPRVSRYSSITALVTSIEATLYTFVRYVGKQTEQPFNPHAQGRRRRLHEEQWTYLENAGIALRRLPFMDCLDCLVTIRNCMVHAAGVVDDRDGKLARINDALRRVPGFGVEDGVVDVAPDAVPPLVDEAREWLLAVSGMINKHFREIYEAPRH